MRDWNKIDMLEVVELFAEDNGMISTEEELSERFDAEVLPAVIEQYGENDEPAINEAFNNWTVSLRDDGVIHSEQYNSYYYVGRLA